MHSITPPRLPGFYTHEGVKPECVPFAHLDGNREVTVFFHGFTGSPHDFRNFVTAYRAAGLDVVVPLIPGHGSHVSHLERLGLRELFIPFEPLMDYLVPRYEAVHLVGLSYGAVLMASLALRRKAATVSFFAPAFCLTQASEKNMWLVRRLGLHRVKGRVTKKVASKNRGFKPHPFTYPHIPFYPVLQLHACAKEMQTSLRGVDWRVFHAHGDADDTTAWETNHVFLKKAVADYTFYRVPGGSHVLPLSVGNEALAQAHIQWLKGS